jgi:hypothetical protein
MMAKLRGSLVWRESHLGEVELCILEEGIRPYITWGSLDSCMEDWSWLGDAWVVIVFMQGKWI